MRPNRPGKMDKKHPEGARDAMEDIKELASEPKSVQNDIGYMNANRDRALGEADRTGRHYDEDTGGVPDEDSEVSKDRRS